MKIHGERTERKTRRKSAKKGELTSNRQERERGEAAQTDGMMGAFSSWFIQQIHRDSGLKRRLDRLHLG